MIHQIDDRVYLVEPLLLTSLYSNLPPSQSPKLLRERGDCGGQAPYNIGYEK